MWHSYESLQSYIIFLNHINFYKKKLFISRKRLFLLIYLLNFNYTLLDMCFKVLSGLPGTPKYFFFFILYTDLLVAAHLDLLVLVVVKVIIW